MLTRVLAALIVLFVGAIIYLSSTVAQRQTVLREVAHHNDSWAISQMLVEFTRLEVALALYDPAEAPADPDAVRLRLDIMVSRLTNLREGTLVQFLSGTPARVELISGLTAVVERLDGALDTLDEAERRDIIASMNGLIGPLTALSSESVQDSWSRTDTVLQDLEHQHRIYSFIVAVLIFCWLALLLVQLHHNRLLRTAQQQAMRLNDNLNLIGEELRLKNRQLEHSASHDPLTRLPNRTLFWSELEAALQPASGGVEVSLLLMDLDRFKEVNDTLGHDCGDLLLREASARMGAFRTKTRLFCRLGGDEFACLLIGHSVETSLAFARDLVATIARPYELGDRQVEIGCSIGIANARHSACTDPQQLFKYADIGLYRAKSSPTDRVCLFEEQMQTEFDGRKALEGDLRRAIAGGELSVFYHAQMHAASGELRGMEALARWVHPTRGPIPPGEFIPLAEEIGVLKDLEKLILVTACAEAVTWARPVKIAINCSSWQLTSPDILRIVQDALRVTGLDPARLELEIAESVLLNNREQVFAALTALRRTGVTIAINGFGTGYSSLAVLRDLPFDTIKLDKVFVRDIVRDPDAETLVKLVNDVGVLLGKEVIIEGVETEEQYRKILSLRCSAVQGFLFGQPSPASDLAFLRDAPGADASHPAFRKVSP